MSVTGLKATRRCYRHIIEKELTNGKKIIDHEFEEWEFRDCLKKVKLCMHRLKEFNNKLQRTSEALNTVLGKENKTEDIENIVEEDCDLAAQVSVCLFELSKMIERIRNAQVKSDVQANKTEEKSKLDKEHMFEMQLQMQQQMQQLMNVQQQIQQQQETLQLFQDRQTTKKETSVKLPKLNLVPFSGDKLKCHEFLDSFETTVHKNDKLSNMEKFNYISSTFSGEVTTRPERRPESSGTTRQLRTLAEAFFNMELKENHNSQETKKYGDVYEGNHSSDECETYHTTELRKALRKAKIKDRKRGNKDSKKRKQALRGKERKGKKGSKGRKLVKVKGKNRNKKARKTRKQALHGRKRKSKKTVRDKERKLETGRGRKSNKKVKKNKKQNLIGRRKGRMRMFGKGTKRAKDTDRKRSKMAKGNKKQALEVSRNGKTGMPGKGRKPKSTRKAATGSRNRSDELFSDQSDSTLVGEVSRMTRTFCKISLTLNIKGR